MMTRKHYVAIARILNDAVYDAPDATSMTTVGVISKRLALLFAEDNPNFNEEKFIEAVRKTQ